MPLPRLALGAGLALAVSVAAGPAIYFLASAGQGSPADRTGREVAETPGSQVVAYVDGRPILSDELDVRLDELLPMASYHGRVDPERLLSLRRAALDDLVLDELIYREAITDGRQAAADAVRAELAAVKARFDSAEQFAAALAENGLTERGLRARLARRVVIADARAAHAEQTITEADITAYYLEHRARFLRPEAVHLREILFRVDPADPASEPAAEKKARTTLTRLQSGEDFGALARTLSEDEYRVKDGDMGLVHRGRLDAAFEAAVFAARPGTPGITQSLYGVQVFEVVERQPARQLGLDEARPIIAEGLGRQRREETLQAWHQRLRGGARIEISDAKLRDARPADIPLLPVGPGRHPRPAPAMGSSR